MSATSMEIEARKRFIEKSINASKAKHGFLFAIFYISYYNKIVNKGRPNKKIEDIQVDEVFLECEEPKLLDARSKIGELLYTSGPLVSANLTGPGKYDDTLLKMAAKYPGFDEEYYKIVIGMHVRDSR